MKNESGTNLLTPLPAMSGGADGSNERSVRTQPLIVYLDVLLPEQEISRIQRLSPRLRVVKEPSAESLRQAQVVFTNSARFDVSQSPHLRWVQVNTAAVNQLAGTSLAASDVPVANVHGAYSSDVAEMTIGLLLAMTRKLPACHALQQQSAWPADDLNLEAYSCYGKTMGIIGYGSIGRHIGRMAQAMGMKILACRRNPSQRRDLGFCRPHAGDPHGAIPAAWFGEHEMSQMLRQSDIAVCTLPLTPDTAGAVGTAELEAMPRGSYFINIGRGRVVDEDALVSALNRGHLAGAALDVFAAEPLPATSPLWLTPNLVMTPHIGSWTSGQTQFAVDVFLENLRRDLAGEELINLVDLRAGY